MKSESRHDATRMLARAGRGDSSAAAELMPLVYAELRGIAAAYLRREAAGHTLQPTALVHEAFVRLIDAREIEHLDRAHFLAIAANVMRRVLVEHARERSAAKRGGGARKVTLHSGAALIPDADVEILALDEALERLARLDERQSRVIELRFFAGLAVEDVARVLGMSKRSVEADWTLARAWLKRELSKG